MLNCTDLECILHNPHYYSHSHQLQPANPIDDVREGAGTHENNTDPPPSEALYIICIIVVCVAVVGVSIVVIAVKFSKMRKREDQGKDDVEQPSVVQTNKKDATIKKDSPTTIVTNNGDDTIIQTANDIRNNGIVNAGATIPELTNNGIIDDDHAKSEWHFPPIYRPNTPQYMYNDQDILVHGLKKNRQGFAKGLKNGFRGPFKTVVDSLSGKKQEPVIPPNLRSQLKSIYVY